METFTLGSLLNILAIVAPLAGLLFWFDRKQSARIDRLEDRLDKKIDDQGAELGQRIDNQGTELRQDMRELSQRIDAQGAELGQRIDNQGAELRQGMRSLSQRIDNQAVELQVIRSKVDRMQGTLDLLVYGREVPPPVARSRAEDEERLEAPTGD